MMISFILYLSVFAQSAHAIDPCISKTFRVEPCTGLYCEEHQLTLKSDCTAEEMTKGLVTQYKYEIKNDQVTLSRSVPRNVIDSDQLYFETVNTVLSLTQKQTTLKLMSPEKSKTISYRAKADLDSLPPLSPVDVQKWLARARRKDLGKCTLLENTGGSCRFYVQVSGKGYPADNGCAKQEFMNAYCKGIYQEEAIAACLLRHAHTDGRCE